MLSRSIATFKFLSPNIPYRVKKAVELSTGLEVAIKLMKFTDEDFAALDFNLDPVRELGLTIAQLISSALGNKESAPLTK